MSERLSETLAELVHGVRFGKFVSVGAVGAAADITTLTLLTEVAGVHFAIANVFSIEVAILVMFAINENWTFAEHGDEERKSLGRRLIRSHMVRATGSTIQYVLFVAILTTVTVQLSAMGIDLWQILVKAGSIGVAMIVNYAFESLFTWQVHRESG